MGSLNAFLEQSHAVDLTNVLTSLLEYIVQYVVSLADTVCGNASTSTFVRVLDAVRMGVSTIATSASLNQCASYCKRDVEPSE